MSAFTLEYDAEANALYVLVIEHDPKDISESRAVGENRAPVVVDLDAKGNVLGLEVMLPNGVRLDKKRGD